MAPGLFLRALVAAMIPLWAGPAYAELMPAQQSGDPESRAVLLLPLEVAGDIESRARTMFAAALREGFDRSTLAFRSPNDDQVETAIRCSAPACLEALGQSTSATHMIRARVDNKDRIYDIQIEAIDLRTGVIAASSREACEICGIQEVSNQLAGQAAALGQKLAEIMARRPTLAVVSLPQGARVLPEQKRQRNLRIWGAVTLASGLALAGAGVPLIVLHDRQNILRCDSGNIDADGNCRWTYDTMDVGLGLTLSGAALATVGVALLSTWGARRKRERSSNVRILPRGLGLAVRF